MKNPWTKVSSHIAYQDPWISVRVDKIIQPDNKLGTYSVIELRPCVFVVALTEDKKLCLIEQYRYTCDRLSLELPAGNTDGQDPLIAAKRELKEETGFTATTWHKIGELDLHNGHCMEVMHAFLASDLTQTGNNQQLEDGIQNSCLMSIEEVYQSIHSGRIRDSETIAALMLAEPYLNNQR